MTNRTGSGGTLKVVSPDSLRPLVAVLGPTASGKSHLAVHLAQCFQAEIVNCDSLQIYRGLDIGTAKPTPAERTAAPHHLIDILEPWQLYSAGDFAERARATVREISARGRLPILAGGTGFYFRALVEGLSPGPKRDDALRRRLQMREARRSGSLHRLLTRLDPAAAGRIHPGDLAKTIRALEIRLLAKIPAASLFSKQSPAALEGFTVLRLILEPERSALRQKITARSRQMFAAGLIEELRRLLDAGVPDEAKALQAIGYSQALAVLQGHLSKECAIELTAIATSQYAKRQMTWFRKEPLAKRLAGFGDDPAIAEEAVKLVSMFLESLQGQRNSP